MKKKKPKPRKIIQKIKRQPPLTSEEHLKKSRSEINNRNRGRSREHENRVAVLLSGRRVPNSGAAIQYKGDVEIPFKEHPGKYIIECKTSSAFNAGNDTPQIRILFSWLEKLQKESNAMNALFGVLVIHYFRQNFLKDFVLIRQNDVHRIADMFMPTWYSALKELADTAPIIDIRTQRVSNKPRGGYNINQRETEHAMIAIEGLHGMRYQTPHGLYLVLYLQDFRDIMKGI